MRWLNPPVQGTSSRSRERGAAATIVAVLLAGGVLMGMAALSIDVGQIMFERRQLQNGADSSSLAFADICAKTTADCDPTSATTQAKLKTLLNGNASDAASQLDASRGDSLNGLCGRGTTSLNLPICSSAGTNAPVGNLAECPPLPSWLATGDGARIPYVEAYSLTQSTNGDSILPARFSQLITGQPGTSVRACARAAWGPPGSYSATIPLTISACEWQRQTNSGANYQAAPSGPAPGYGGAGQPAWPPGASEIVVLLHNPGDAGSNCDWNGKDTAGGFGYVDSTNCQALVTTDNWVRIDSGNNVPADCKAIMPGLVGKVVSLPVFDCLISSQATPTGPIPTTPDGICDPTQRNSGGANSWYHILGWAKFYISGYKLSGTGTASILPGGHTDCSTSPGGGDRCLFGWFVQGALDATSIVPPGGGTDFGTYAVLPAG